jgi:hypothetical protein
MQLNYVMECIRRSGAELQRSACKLAFAQAGGTFTKFQINLKVHNVHNCKRMDYLSTQLASV